MNTTLLTALRQIVSQYGGVETLTDARQVKALLADLAAKEPKPQKNALVACIEQGFVPALQNVPAGERGATKAKLVERLNREEGLDMALCADTLDLLETALFGEEEKGTKTAGPGNRFCTACGAALPKEARFCHSCGAAASGTAVSNTYYLSINYQQSGPFSLEQVKGMIGSGRVSKDHWIRAAPGSDWMPVTTLPELKPFFGDSGGKNNVTKPELSVPNQKSVSPVHQEKEVWSLLRTLKGHQVHSVIYSPDGRRIVSRALDTITIWDAESGRKLHTLTNDYWGITPVVYSSDGHRIASSSTDEAITIWDAKSGRKLHTLKGHTGLVSSVAYSPDGRRIVSGAYDNDKTIKIWDAESGRELQTLTGHKKRIMSVAYSPDGHRIVSGSYDKTIKTWDAESGQILYTLKGHTEGVNSVMYSPDGCRIVSGSWDKTIKIWDAESGCELHTLSGHTDGITSVMYSPDERRIVSGSIDETIKIWGVE